jgi:hypothetical protein
MSPAQAGAGPLLVVRYRRGLGIVALVVGGLSLLLGIATRDPLNIVLGIILGAVGVAYVVGRALVVTGSELQLKSPIGLTTRRFPVLGPRDLALDGKTLRHVPEDRKIITLGMSVDPGDVERLRAWVSGAAR